jgi:hypothetical protein
MNTSPRHSRADLPRLALAALALLAALDACAPAVTHGPRVEPGPALFATMGAPRPLCRAANASDCTADLVPTWGLGARYGHVPDNPAAPALLAGVTLPIFDLPGAELDAFVQLPSGGDWVGGAGALTSARHLMPYAQVGQLPRSGGPGWYASLAYARLFQDPGEMLGSGDSARATMARPPRFWAPGVGVRARHGRTRYTVFVNAALGSWRRRSFVIAPTVEGGSGESEVITREPVRTLMLGITWERAFADLGFPRRMLPPRPGPR